MVLADSPTELINQERCRNQANGDESQHTVTPTESESRIHGWTSEGKEGTEGRTRDSECCNTRGGEIGEGIDDIGLDGNEDSHHTEAKGNEAYDWDDPLCFISTEKF
jgi:hypothetical protein